MEQIADIPVPHHGIFGGFQGFHPGQSTAASSEQIVDIPLQGGPHLQDPGLASLPQDVAGEAFQGFFFSTFPRRKKSAQIGPHSWSELLPESSQLLQEVDVEQHDHRDGTYEKEAWVTVAFWDEGLSLIGFVTDFVRAVRVIFPSHRQSGTGSVVFTATCATSALSQITSNKNGYGILGRFSYCSTKRIEVLSNEIERSHPLRCTPSLLYLESNCECMCHFDHRRRFPIKIIGRVVRILMLQEAVKTSTLHSAKFRKR